MKSLTTPLIIFGFLGNASAAVSLSSNDSFESGVDGWQDGAATTVVHSTNQSWNDLPGHLINTSSGTNGQGRRFLLWNEGNNWTGDYSTAGVTAISMWVDNRSGAGSTVPLRIALNGPGGWFMSNAALITDVTAGQNEWQLINYSLDADNLSYITGGTNELTSTLSDVSQFEILINTNGSPSQGGSGNLRGDTLTADIRFDNIRAIPEPSGISLVLMGIVFGLHRRQR